MSLLQSLHLCGLDLLQLLKLLLVSFLEASKRLDLLFQFSPHFRVAILFLFQLRSELVYLFLVTGLEGLYGVGVVSLDLG